MGTSVLVTGGAGYVGAHTARALAHRGDKVVIFDNLQVGYEAACSGELIVGDLRDRELIDRVLARGFDCVVHFAGRTEVGLSMADPLTFFDVNVSGTLNLIAACRKHGCGKIVFSSTAAVYGVPEETLITESSSLAPINPYGVSKLMVEKILQSARKTGEIASISLRYFNACGASEDAWIGEAHSPETHLIPLALTTVLEGKPLNIYGNDYPTPDGTCIRDYVHVLDLADGHLNAVDLLLEGHDGGEWNLGTGTGHSVAEVVDAIRRVTGRELTTVIADRRPGDPPVLVANASRAKTDLGWSPRRSLDDAIRTAWSWAQRPRYGPQL